VSEFLTQPVSAWWTVVALIAAIPVGLLIAEPFRRRMQRKADRREPLTPEQRRLDRLETLNRAIADALYSTREARIYTSDDFSDLDAVRAMRERLGFASDSLVSAQREVTEWLRVAVAKERADA
jgi:hypothetical protein